jgi:hypothetical protein
MTTGGCHQKTCALRAPTVFSGRIKTIRPENTVMNKSKNDIGLFLSKIVDCARMALSSVRNKRSARTVFRPRSMRKPEADAERDSRRHV